MPTPTGEMGVDMAQGEEMGPANDMGTLEDMPADMAVDMDMGQPLDMMPDLPPDMQPSDMQGDDMPTDDMAPDMPSCVSGNDGGQQDTFTICNSDDLLMMEGSTDIFELGADITLPPGFRSLRSFRGTLDGQGHTISNVTLTRDEALERTCPRVEKIYVGGFIDEVGDGASISNITFLDVVSGEAPNEPLPYSTSPGMCPFITGGVFGKLSGASVLNVSVRGLKAFSDTTYGGFVGHASRSTLTDVHVLGSTSDAVAIQGNGLTGGFAYHVENVDLTRVSFQGAIASSTDSPQAEQSLFVVNAEQSISFNNIAVRGKLETTGSSRFAAGLIARLNTEMASTIEAFAVEVVIESEAPTVGGLIAQATVPPGVNLTVKNGYVGELVASPRSLKGSEVIGGLFGSIQNRGGGTLVLSNLYAHSDLNITDPNAGLSSVGCNYGKIEAPPSGPNSDWIDVFPDMENQSLMSAALRCDGRAHITPAGNTYFQDVGGSYRIRQLETDWFGALRDMNLTL